MKINFDYFQIPKMLQTVRVEKVDETNFVDCNILDAMLNFVLRYSVVSDGSIEIGVRF